MKRNPNYHIAGLPYFDAIEFVNIIDIAARTNALITGEVDYMVDVDIKTMELLKRSPDISVVRTQGVRHFTFDMNTEIAPFNNPDFRKALKYAIDREDITNKAFLGNAVLANDNPVAPQIQFAVDPAPQHKHDLEKAKEYLKKSGLSDVSIDLSVADTAFPGAMDAALLFKDHAAKIGVNINVIREADDGYWDKIWRHKPFVGVDWSGRPTCDSLFTTVYREGAPWNDTLWKNDRFNELLVMGRATGDNDKRQEIYAEMQQLLHDDGGTIVLAFAYYIDAASNKLAHDQIGSTFQCDNLRMAERWWMA
jgi:peptide/nickel transport system substrate-binding protein